MLIAGMSLQDWVQMRSRELRTKEKQKTSKKEGTVEMTEEQGTGEPREEQSGTMDGAIGSEQGGAEELVKAEVPLVRKRRRLVKVSQVEPVHEVR